MTNGKPRACLSRTAISTAVCLIVGLLSTVSALDAAVIRDFRIGSQQGYLRMVLESDRPLKPPSVAVDARALKISLADIINTPPTPRPGRIPREIERVDIHRTSTNAVITATLRFTPIDIKTFSLTGPHRLIIDLYRALSPERPTPNAPGPSAAHGGNAPEAYSVFQNAFPSVPAGTTTGEGAADDADNDAVDRGSRSRSQRQLLGGLIAVTSMIAGLLVFLLRSNRRRKAVPAVHRWDSLPPVVDPEIDRIDEAIREGFDAIDQS